MVNSVFAQCRYTQFLIYENKKSLILSHAAELIFFF